jgi:transposase-like protein
MSATPETNDIKPLQNKILSYLAGGNSVADAAERAGIHRNTINNWRRSDPAFADMMEDAFAERTLLFRDQAETLVPKALDVLKALLEDQFTTQSIRLRAALAILKMAESGAVPAKTAQRTAPKMKIMHNSAQSTPHRPAETGLCRCGSGLNAQSCCLSDKQPIGPMPLRNPDSAAA